VKVLVNCSKPQSIQAGGDKLPAPKGIGMAVAFDWGLTVELLLIPILSIFLGSSLFPKQVNLDPRLTTAVTILFLWPIAVLFALFGESIRHGVRWTRPVQIVGNTLGFLGGFGVLVQLLNGIKAGNFWPVVPAVILLFFSPLLAWRLSRPETARWFASVTSAEARKRHGGIWIWEIAAWAIVGGALQAWVVFH
jgi:hypothetical protein